MLDKKVVQFKARMRDITAAQECEAEEGRRDDNRVVQFKPSMPDTAPAQAMAADLMALVERHKHLSHEVVVANLVLQIIFYGMYNHVSGFSLVARLCHEVHAVAHGLVGVSAEVADWFVNGVPRVEDWTAIISRHSQEDGACG
jgi:hypothetical protein